MKSLDLPHPSRNNLAYNVFVWLIVLVGIAITTYSLSSVTSNDINWRFFLLAAVTLLLASRISVPIPFINGQVSASETFIFLTIFLCGGKAAVLLAAAEGICSSYNYTKTKLTTLFNASMLALSAFLSANLITYFYPQDNFIRSEVNTLFIFTLLFSASAYYLTNITLIAVRTTLKTGRSFFVVWREYLVWVPLSYIAGASAAAIASKLTLNYGFQAAILTLPIVGVFYTAYQVYRRNLETTAEKAAEAERHVAELNEYIAEQERLRAKVAQAERLSSLGEMASGVAHNFNNTLAAIMGRAQLALRDKELGDTARRSLEIIVKTANDGAGTVRRIQDLARSRNNHNFNLIAVDQLMIDVSEVTRPRWKDFAEASNAHITLALELSSKAWVMGDAGELREVLVNMIFNAVDAMPNGGRLTLATRETAEGVELSVSDTGTGMSDEVRSRIFDPFYTTKGVRGIGLGLAVSYGIIARHNGNVTVDTEENRGTTFRITLPFAPAEARHARLRSTAHKPASAATVAVAESPHAARILVVEDEADVGDIITEVLHTAHCEVTRAASGTEAIRILETQRFDAVFTDIGLPGISGWEVARHIRANDADLFIAVITGWGDTATAERIQRSLHIQRLVPKPFDINTIAELAATAIEHSHNLKRERAHAIKQTTLDTSSFDSKFIN